MAVKLLRFWVYTCECDILKCGCRASTGLNVYLDIVDKGRCMNILEVSHSKQILSGKIL